MTAVGKFLEMGDMEKIGEMFERIDANMRNINVKLDNALAEMRQVKEENKRLREKVLEQEERINNLEREVRKKNVVMKGVIDEESEKQSDTGVKISAVLRKIGVDLNVEQDLDEARRIGRFNPQKKRPILIKLTKESTRMTILKNAKLLKGTDIWIDEDYPKEIQEERRILITQMKEAREKGHKAQVKYNKLIVDGEVYRANELESKVRTEEEAESGSTRLKRTVYERSPEGDKFVEQLRKISRTNKKN